MRNLLAVCTSGRVIFAAYGDNIKTVPELKNTVKDIFFDGQLGD